MALETRDQQEAARTSPPQERPELPPRQSQPSTNVGPRNSQGLNGQPVPDTSNFEPPPQRLNEPGTYHQRPFPNNSSSTPRPPPPFHYKSTDGKREGITQWTKRHWYQELREAKTRKPHKGSKITRWKRLKWRGTRATNWGITAIKTSTLEFLNRVATLQDQADDLAEDVYSRTVAPEEILLIYPPTLRMTPDDNDTPPSTQETFLRTTFFSTFHRAQRKACKDTFLSTLLSSPAVIIDTLAMPIWPFGGLAEIDAVWFYASVRGARTCRDVDKRIQLQEQSDEKEKGRGKGKQRLELTFLAAEKGEEIQRMDVIEQYLAAKCHEADAVLLPAYVSCPSETKVLEAMGWECSRGYSGRQSAVGGGSGGGGGDVNTKATTWDDEQWELMHIENDLKVVFAKGAKEWAKWVKLWRKKPSKAVKR